MDGQRNELIFLRHNFSLTRDEDIDPIVKRAHALASPERLRILRGLYINSMTITEVARTYYMSVSTATFHLNILREAGLIDIVLMPGKRGRVQLCQNRFSSLYISAYPEEDRRSERIVTHEIPVGLYTGAGMEFVAGFCTADEQIMFDDGNYFTPQRAEAQLLWSSGGYVEYTVSNTRSQERIERITITLELCSETLNYQLGWKSDITFWLCGRELGTRTSPSDFGGRRGKLNPAWWSDQCTQYGELCEITIGKQGVTIDGVPVGNPEFPVCVEDFSGCDCLVLRLGNKPDARYRGGFNIFGRGFGDHMQDIKVALEYQ